MSEFPFQLLIKRTCPKGGEESLTCTAVLRRIPGKRLVYDALWQDRGVIVKVFSHRISARRHLKREWRGLSILRERGLNLPEPLFTGKTEDGYLAVVVDKIAGSSTALDVFNEAKDETTRLDLLILVCRELARQHDKGVLQKDLHLGNFLLQADKVFALDAGQMRFFSHSIARKRSISELALLASCLPADDTGSMTRLCEEYFKVRNWRFGRADERLLQRQLSVRRERAVRKGLKKCLRTSKRYLRIKSGRYVAVFDKGFCQGTETLDFIKQIDTLMDKGAVLKRGGTSYVSCVGWHGKDIVIKRYNHKGFIHSVRHTIKKSRAHRGWLHGNRLGMLDIATPKPIVYIEQRKGMLVWKSYLVTEYVEGQKLYDFLRDDNVTEQQRLRVVDQMSKLLARLRECKISHSDLKHSNILVTETGLVLTDLDAMKTHRYKCLYEVYHAKDAAFLPTTGTV
ncbi:MAG: protein kinase [Planctomycetota bacterium]|nr:MAG: protein kinase [Planctomycetota bacterium]